MAEVEVNQADWNTHGWQGEVLTCRNKLDIFRIYLSFPDSMINDYHVENFGLPGMVIKLGEWVKENWQKKKRYVKREIFHPDTHYVNKVSFEK